MRLFSIAAIMIMLSGCAVSQQTPVPRIPFPAAEFAALPTKGTGTLTGQVFMKTVGGDVKFGAGSTVYLVPVTSYSKQWYEVNYIGGQALEAPDPRSGQGSITTVADGNGNFTFTDIPPGDYFLSSTVTWQAPSKYGLLPQGGVVAKVVSIADGVKLREMLTR
ncbi:hypothetical protein ACIUW1_11825 [Pseudomonas aeruginosa]